MSTIVPHGMDEYYKARPRLAIPKKEVLAIDLPKLPQAKRHRVNVH